ncbi:MAG: (Na+)-NQR maturation NqrM [Haliea sp.]|uniref:(Na+)-NQR maturation NqrM n=1 Tax=Haliea sp. TaxID=1932666 RepID=UPI0032EC88D2
MTVFVLTAALIGIVMAIMAVGVIMGRGPIKGSCGGMGALGFDTACDICGGDPKRCEEETRDSKGAAADNAQFYPADR